MADNSMDRKAADKFGAYGYGIIAVRYQPHSNSAFQTKFWQEEFEEEAWEFAIGYDTEPFDWGTGERLY